MYYVVYSDELYHHGTKGQKWGVRKYQNVDGSLKPAGEKRYTENGSSGKKSIKGNLSRTIGSSSSAFLLSISFF